MSRYRFVDSQKADAFPVADSCRAVGVSTSTYSAWRRQHDAGPTPAQQVETELVEEIGMVHEYSGATYGSPPVCTPNCADEAIPCYPKRSFTLLLPLVGSTATVSARTASAMVKR